jgi:hypothetical protein
MFINHLSGCTELLHLHQYSFYVIKEQLLGQFKDSKKHGKGKMTYCSGKVEDGMWSNGNFIK